MKMAIFNNNLKKNIKNYSRYIKVFKILKLHSMFIYYYKITWFSPESSAKSWNNFMECSSFSWDRTSYTILKGKNTEYENPEVNEFNKSKFQNFFKTIP